MTVSLMTFGQMTFIIKTQQSETTMSRKTLGRTAFSILQNVVWQSVILLNVAAPSRHFLLWHWKSLQGIKLLRKDLCTKSPSLVIKKTTCELLTTISLLGVPYPNSDHDILREPCVLKAQLPNE